MKIGESKEDYLEAAYVLKRQKGYVRNSMLSDYLNYSKASVSVCSTWTAGRWICNKRPIWQH